LVQRLQVSRAGRHLSKFLLQHCNAPETSLEFVDLDVDLFVDGAANIAVLDEDEFRENAAIFDYPPEVEAAVRSAAEELTGMIRLRDFPFDHPDFRNIPPDRS
jgi:protein associated with RNAse G/E